MPACDERIYAQIRARLGDEPPAGLLSRVAVKQPTGLRYLDVWRTREDWETFRDKRVEPVVSEVLAAAGIPHDHSVVSSEAIDVVDTWVGHPA